MGKGLKMPFKYCVLCRGAVIMTRCWLTGRRRWSSWQPWGNITKKRSTITRKRLSVCRKRLTDTRAKSENLNMTTEALPSSSSSYMCFSLWCPCACPEGLLLSLSVIIINHMIRYFSNKCLQKPAVFCHGPMNQTLLYLNILMIDV